MDPHTNLEVRFTDNGLKDGDFYPDDQTPKPLILNPAGAPYSELAELDIPDDGEEDWSVEDALDAHMLIEDEAFAGDVNGDS